MFSKAGKKTPTNLTHEKKSSTTTKRPERNLCACSVAKSSLTLCRPTDCIRLLCPWDFPHEYWSGLPFPSPGDLSGPGIEPGSPVAPPLAGGLFTTEPPVEATKKLYGTKNNRVHVQLGQILEKRNKKTQKPNCQFWRAWSKSRVLCHAPYTQHLLRRGKPCKLPLQPDPWTPLPSPHIRNQLTLPSSGISKLSGETVSCSHFPLLQQGPWLSHAWITCLASDQFLLTVEGQGLWWM